MLEHKGTNELATPYLTLRAVQENDYIEMHSSFAFDKEVLGEKACTLEEEKAFCDAILDLYPNCDCYYWLICDTQSGAILGAISVMKYDKENASCEIGYCLAKKHWGKSITPDALSMVMWYLFAQINFNKLYMRILPSNKRSIRVAEKCGFTKDGVLKDDLAQDGVFKDVAVYSITRKMFDKYLEE